MRWIPSLLVTTALLGLPFTASAQTPSPNAPRDPALQARLDRMEQIRNMPDLLRDSLITPRWVGTDDRLVYWDETGPHAGAWVLVEAASGQAAPILPPETLREQLAALTGEPVPALTQMGFIGSPDGQAILFRFRNKPFRLDLSGGQIRPVEGFDALVAGGAPSPDGRWVAGARGGALAVRDAAGAVRFERPGAPDQSWSLPDKAWSPDGRLAAVRTDQRAVHRIPIVTYEGGLEQVAMVPYPKTGTPLPIAELHLIDPATGQSVQAAPPPDEGYDWFVGWRPNGEALALHLSRDGKRLDLSAVDRTGARRILLSEARPETNIGDLDFITADWSTQVTPLADGGFLWLSERTGWKHVYRYDRDGALVGPVTAGDFPVRRVDAVGADGALLVSASPDPERPYDQSLHRVALAGGPLQPVGGGAPGLHRAVPSPSGRYVVDSWSAPDRPRVRQLVAVDGRAPLPLTASDDAAARAHGWRPAERVEVLAADGVTRLHGAVFTPSDFDPAKRYPVVAYIYGGPFVTVLTGGYFSTMEMSAAGLAEAGFVVVAIDVRGSALRDKAFQDATYGRIGQTEIPDYVAGLRQISASRPWMDMQRVGIHGYSWGGYYALRGMLTAPELFKAGYAGAPGALEEDASVNEPNMGLLADNPDGYAAASNMALAGNLQGHLRILHGTSDGSASVSTTLRMAEALIAADKQFEMLLIPGMDHSPEGQNSAYFTEDLALFFLRTLGAPE